MPTMTGEQLQALRKAAKMSQAELADAIGMSRETIGQMERDQAPIERRTALAVRHVCEDHSRVAELVELVRLTASMAGRALSQAVALNFETRDLALAVDILSKEADQIEKEG